MLADGNCKTSAGSHVKRDYIAFLDFAGCDDVCFGIGAVVSVRSIGIDGGGISAVSIEEVELELIVSDRKSVV